MVNGKNRYSAGHPLEAAETHLTAIEPIFRLGVDRHGPCALLDRQHSHFHVLIRTIVEQQLSVKAAQSIAKKLLLKAGGDQFEVKALVNLTAEDMRLSGLSNAKARYIRGIAEAVTTGKLELGALEYADDQKVIDELMRYPGIGLWTAEVFLMFSLRRLDVLPLGDLVLRNAIKHYFQLDKGADKQCLFDIAEPWRPYRSVASWYLWALLENK